MAPETHTVEYLGDFPTEYVRIELRTEPLERPVRDVRLRAVVLDPSKTASENQFENAQVRILRVMCAAGESCPQSAHPGDPAGVVTMSGSRRGAVEWPPAPGRGQIEQVMIELKTQPLKGLQSN